MKTAERICFAAGVALLAWLFYRIGADALRTSLTAVGWGFLLVFALQVPAILVNTLAWRQMLPPEHRALPLRSLASMLLAGDAINAVTPSAVVGGELMRVSLLRRRVATATAVGSTSLAAMAQFFAQILFVLTGVPVALGFVHDAGVRTGLLLLTALLCIALALLVSLGWWRSGWKTPQRWLDRIGWLRKFREEREATWKALADATLGTLRRRPGDFALSVALHYAGWLVGAVEVRLILWLLRAPVGWRQAFAIEALALAVEAAFFFVPAKMGTQEGGKVVIFHILGLDPARGFALGFVRRLRELAWAAVGLSLLGWSQRHSASETADAEAPEIAGEALARRYAQGRDGA